MKNNRKQLLKLVFLFIVGFGVSFLSVNQVKAVSDNVKFTVHYIDVGAGDGALLQYGEGENAKYALIDAGPIEYERTDDAWVNTSKIVLNYLKKHNITELEFALVTHPHVDHMGGFLSIFEDDDIHIKKIYVNQNTINLNNPNFSTTDNLYDTDIIRRFDEALEKRQRKSKEKKLEEFVVEEPVAGKKVWLGPEGEGMLMEILGPVDTDFIFGRAVSLVARQVNKYSVVCKLTYGTNTFLMTGDTQKEPVQDMISKGKNLQAQVLKVPHHGMQDVTEENKKGDYTSDHKLLFDRTQGALAIVSNGYKNANRSPLDRTVRDLGEYNIYTTSHNGSIKVVSDGKKLSIEGSKSSTAEEYGEYIPKTRSSRLLSAVNVKTTGAKTLNPTRSDAANTYNLYEKKPVTVSFSATARSFTDLTAIQYKVVNKGVSNTKVSYKNGNQVTLGNGFCGRIYVRFVTPIGSTVMKLPGFTVDTKAPTSAKIKGNKKGIKTLSLSSQNSYKTKFSKYIKLYFSASYGTSGKYRTQYKIVPKGKSASKYKWKTGNSVTYKTKKKKVRVYVRFTDKSGNITERKTNGFYIK
ncbi:MAG: MBL fold metallo-hydrolase [Anaerostipes faecalis]|nr:MBL fold metallo-hydrolase [Anaerostipes faecalis]